MVILNFSGKEIIIEGRCNMCGNCCRHINLRSDGNWITNKKLFETIIKERPEYGRFEITGKNNTGSLNFRCSCLKEDTACGDYLNRLDICKNFPEKNIYFGSAGLPEGCGYTLKKKIPFKKIMLREIKKT